MGAEMKPNCRHIMPPGTQRGSFAPAAATIIREESALHAGPFSPDRKPCQTFLTPPSLTPCCAKFMSSPRRSSARSIFIFLAEP